MPNYIYKMLCAICFDTEGEIIPAHENFSHMFHPECLTVALESLNSFSCPLCFTKIDLKLVTSLAINEELRLTYDTGNLSKFGELVENDEIDIGDNLKYILIHDRPAEFLQVLMDHLIANELTINLASDLRYALSHGKLYLAKILVRTIILRPDLTYIFRSLYRVLEFIAKEKSLFCLFAQNMESSQSLVFFYEDCEMGLLEKVALWIECLPDLLTDGHLYEALCRTANEGKYDVCKFLLSYTEGRTFFDEHQRLLRSVCNNRWWDLYKAFESIQFGTYIDYNIPFTMAISDMNWNLAKNLWKRGGRLKEQEWSKCLLANINLCDVIGIKSLLDRGKYSIYNKGELLVRACELGFVEAVQILIEYGVNIHANHGRALIVTCQRSKVKILEFLLSNIQGNEPYFLDAINTAASFGSNRILGMLLNFIKGINYMYKHFYSFFNLIERKCCLPFRYYEKILTNTALTADQIKSFYHAFIRPKLWKANILGNFNDLERAKVLLI